MPDSRRRHRPRRHPAHRLAPRWLAPALAAALTGALLTQPATSAAAAGSGAGSSASAIAAVRAAAKGGQRQAWNVTLVTGDRVRVVRDPAGHQQVTTTPAPSHPAGRAFRTVVDLNHDL